MRQGGIIFMTEMVYGTVESSRSEPSFVNWLHTVDRWSILCILALFGIGLLLGLAASPPLAEKNGYAPFYYVYKQVIFGCTALFVMLVLSFFSKNNVRRFSVLFFLATFFALIFLPFLGTDFGKGATRWYSFGFGSLQPSEFLKPVFVVFSAWLIAESEKINGPPGKILSFLMAAIISLLLILQPDFGQAALVLFGWVVVYFIGGAPIILLIIIAGAVICLGIFMYIDSEHFARRIDGFLSTDVDPTTQMGFVTNAIREGGWFGVGVGEGEVKWSLPDAHTDFIIAVAAEEYGLILVAVIIMLYTVFTIRCLYRLMKKKDPFVKLAGAGLTAMFAMQAIINMGVAVRLLPAKGMTLPFVSNGGSSLIATGIGVGMLLVFTRSRPQGEVRDLLAKKRINQ
jgi:cell division protein FtsW